MNENISFCFSKYNSNKKIMNIKQKHYISMTLDLGISKYCFYLHLLLLKNQLNSSFH